jgi:hypothetical protein
MRSTMTAVACAVLGTLGLLAIPASGARAGDIVVSLPITGFSQMVVDSANSHLFFSQGGGAGASSILVTDFSGNTVTTISEPDGVAGMALSPDGSTLYAALTAGDAVVAISTSNLTQTASYDLGSPNAPFSVAVQSGKLWISYDTGMAGQSSIGEIDPSAMTPTFTPQAAPGTWTSAPHLASDPSDGGFLVAVVPDQSPANAASYNTTTVPATVRAQAAEIGGGICSNAEDLAVAPGGAEFSLACGSLGGDFRFSTADLSQVGEYASSVHANAAAIAATAGTVAAGTTAVLGGAGIYFYEPGATTPLNEFGTGGAQLANQGLGLSADGSELFAVTSSSGAFSLRVFQQPTITRTALTLTGAAKVLVGATLTLSGSLTLSNGGALPPGASVTVTRTAPDNTQTALPAVQPASDGSFTLTDTPTAAGAYSYTASYAGDSTTTASTSAPLAVTASLNTSTLTLSGPSNALLNKPLTLSGSLTLGGGAPLPTNTSVTITRTAPDKKQTQQSVQPMVNGSFTVTDTPTESGNYTYVASYAGDANTASATSLTVVVTAALNTAMLRLSGPSLVTFGANVVVTGKLTFGIGNPAAGTLVTVVRTPAGSTVTKTFPPLKLNTAGGFTLTDHAPAKGRYTYTFTYAGDASTAKAKAALTVTVARTTPSLQLITSSPDYVFDTRIRVTAALGATFADRTVSIYAKPAGQPATLVETGKVNASGDLSVSYVLSRSTVFSAVFAGDVHNAPVTVTRGVGAFVKVVMTNSGYFETVTIRHIGFRVYHHTGHLNTAITVTPNKQGQCVDLEVQQWDSQIGWFPNATIGCYTLSTASKISTYLTLLDAGGAQYRMRADYVRSSSDTTNINTDGSWFYFEVVN